MPNRNNPNPPKTTSKRKRVTPKSRAEVRARPYIVPAAHAAMLAGGDTRSRVERIVASYGRVEDPDGQTIVGPAVTDMGNFTGRVNSEFGKHYHDDDLDPGWDINQTAYFIDHN